jgi:hypothetical protein
MVTNGFATELGRSGGGSFAYTYYISLHGMQTAQLQYDQGEEEPSGSYGNQKVLPFLQETHNA